MTYSKQDLNDRMKETVEFRRKIESSYLNKSDWSGSEVNKLIHMIGQYIKNGDKMKNVAKICCVKGEIISVETTLFTEHLGQRPHPEITIGERMSQLVSALEEMEHVLNQMV